MIRYHTIGDQDGEETEKCKCITTTLKGWMNSRDFIGEKMEKVPNQGTQELHHVSQGSNSE